MEINYNIISLIDILGLVQGVFLGLILVVESKRIKPKLFLGLFLLAYSAELLNSILGDLNILEFKPSLLYLPLDFRYLTIPLFYLYIKRIFNSPLTKKKNLLILLPGIIEFLFFAILFVLNLDTKLRIHNSEKFSDGIFLFAILSYPYSIYYAILTIKFINKQKKNVEDYYSNTEGKLLTWAKGVMVFLLLFILIIISTIFVEGKFYTDYMYPVISSVNVIFIFWIGISGLRQPKLFVSKNSITKKENIESSFNENSKNKSIINKTYYKKLIELMVGEKMFLEPNLSLADVSIKLKIPQRNLSELIREESDKNFNQFVNYYRVEEAKKLLLDASNNHLNMLGIAFDSGFSSKATFYSVFKKHTSKTPKLFKNSNLH